MKDKLEFLWILPNLNEKIEIIKKNIKLINSFSKRKFKSYKIALMDGGSNEGNLLELLEACSKYKNVSPFLVLPCLRPTKNKGIMDALNEFKAKNVAIIDIDCENLSNNMLKKLISPIINNIADLSLPKVSKTGGRANRIICNPLLDIFFPEISRKISYPLSGIICLNYNLLRKAIKKDYFWDWGGEIQIIINGAERSRVKEFNFDKIDKKRGIKSKKDDARQFYRTIIYEAVKRGLDKNIYFKHYKKVKINKSLYENYLVKYLGTDTIKEILFSKKKYRIERNIKSQGIDNLKLKNISKELIYLHLYYLKIFFSSKRYIKKYLDRCKDILNKQHYLNFAKSIRLENVDKDRLKKIIRVYNSNKSVDKKYELIMKNYNLKLKKNI